MVRLLARVVALSLVCQAFPPMAAAAEAPLWLDHPEQVFPSSKYMTFSAMGPTSDEARRSALAQVSLFLGAEIKVEETGYKVALDSQKGGVTEARIESRFSQVVEIKGRNDVLGLHFTPEYWPSPDSVALVAYWDRAETADILAGLTREAIAGSDRALNAYRTAQPSSLRAWTAGKLALSHWDEARRLDRLRLLIAPDKQTLINPVLSRQIEDARQAVRRPKASIVFEGQDPAGIPDTLRETLTSYGFELGASPLGVHAAFAYEPLSQVGSLHSGRARLELGFSEGEMVFLSLALEGRAVGTSKESARVRSINDLAARLRKELPDSLQAALGKYVEQL